MDTNKKRNVVALLSLLFLAFFLPLSLLIIINQDKRITPQSVGYIVLLYKGDLGVSSTLSSSSPSLPGQCFGAACRLA
jgi:hypothetical protein